MAVCIEEPEVKEKPSAQPISFIYPPKPSIICPIRHWPGGVDRYCVEKECAWWWPKESCCSVRGLSPMWVDSFVESAD